MKITKIGNPIIYSLRYTFSLHHRPRKRAVVFFIFPSEKIIPKNFRKGLEFQKYRDIMYLYNGGEWFVSNKPDGAELPEYAETVLLHNFYHLKS